MRVRVRVRVRNTATGLVQLRQGGLTASDQIVAAEKAGAWSEALALYEQALSQESAASAAAAGADAAAGPAAGAAAGGERSAGAAADALMRAARAVASGQAAAAQPGAVSVLLQPARSTAAAAAASLSGLSGLQVGQLRCLLQMGHHQALLRQVDGLLARCVGSGGGSGISSAAAAADAAAAVAAAAAGDAQWCVMQLSALGVAAAWRLGAWGLLRGYLGVMEAVGPGARPLPTSDQWEVRGHELVAVMAT